jgi:hypothetical protein
MKHENEIVCKWSFDKATYVQACSRSKHIAEETKITNMNSALLSYETRLVLCFILLSSPQSLENTYK